MDRIAQRRRIFFLPFSDFYYMFSGLHMLASSTASCLVEAVESSEGESVTAQVQLLQLIKGENGMAFLHTLSFVSIS